MDRSKQKHVAPAEARKRALERRYILIIDRYTHNDDEEE